MKLKNLLQVLCVNIYVLDFYDGNTEGMATGEVFVDRGGALDYRDYVVHVIHRADRNTAEITLKSKDYRKGLEGGKNPMIDVDPREDEPTYEELEHKCTWLRGSLYEARKNYQKTTAWNAALLIMFVTSTVLLVLTWSGYIVV